MCVFVIAGNIFMFLLYKGCVICNIINMINRPRTSIAGRGVLSEVFYHRINVPINSDKVALPK